MYSKNTTKQKSKYLVTAGLCLALALFLPFLTMQIPTIGKMLSPMHIPVLLCGLVCPAPYALLVGFAAPLLRSLLFGMPPPVPTALLMTFELAVYGLAAALLSKYLPKKTIYIYVSLLAAMVAGRLVWGLMAMLFYPLLNIDFSLSIYWNTAFVQAVPGIITHILLIPPIVIALRKSKLME